MGKRIMFPSLKLQKNKKIYELLSNQYRPHPIDLGESA